MSTNEIERYSVLTDDSLSYIKGGLTSKQWKAIDYWYWKNVENQGGTPIYMR
ncbi:MAG: hypothetical protein LBT37_05155 [Lactobacillaceae bacterium]|nr:hypothetical protein [Lactobacillaceae bacterium]